MVHDAIRQGGEWSNPANNVIRAISVLELSPDECTAEVLQALWAIHEEFGQAVVVTWTGMPAWMQAVYSRIVEYT